MGATDTLRSLRRLAVVLGLLGAAVAAIVVPSPVDRDVAVARASEYLDAPVDVASLSVDGRRWTVEAGSERAVLDAETGELLEIEF
ncbi:MAG: hypothetical protein AAGA54_09895 [Myxococcota bacterium]